MSTIYQVTLPYACFGIELESKGILPLLVVTKAPPIAKWMVGFSLDMIKLWVTRKDGKLERIE